MYIKLTVYGYLFEHVQNVNTTLNSLFTFSNKTISVIWKQDYV